MAQWKCSESDLYRRLVSIIYKQSKASKRKVKKPGAPAATTTTAPAAATSESPATDPASPAEPKHPTPAPAPAPAAEKTATRRSGREGKPSPGSGGDHGRPRVSLPANMEPTYFLGGGNGNALIEETLQGMGYKRIKDKHDDTYKFKWCELKGAINYHTFREGEQMVNHIPNCQLLTNKLGLLTSLQEYDRMCVMVKRKPSRLDFIPETFKLDDKNEREAFLQSFKDGDMWICKPTGKNQGKGIFLVRDLEELTQIIKDNEEVNQGLREQGKPQRALNRIIQQYIPNPLLLEGKKFDIRAYMLIANTSPYLVLYHKGYVRLCMYEYEMDASNLTAHLTNQYIQKKDPKYKEAKEDTAWSMDRFNDYINDKVAAEKGLEQDWVYNTLTNRMKQIMTYCFNAVKHKLQCKVGYSDLYGLDFMVDEDMKVWLIEVNVNPTLATNCEALRGVIPPVVKETIHLSIECFEKSRRMRPLMPLQSLKNFQILYNASPRANTGSVRQSYRSTTATPSKGPQSSASAQVSSHKSEGHRSVSTSPVRRARSLSPVKEATENSGNGSSNKPKATTTMHRHVLKATPTLLSPSQPAARQSDRLAGSMSGQVVKPMRERTMGAYRPGIIRTVTRDPKPAAKSPNAGTKPHSVKSSTQDKNPNGKLSNNKITPAATSDKSQDTAKPGTNSNNSANGGDRKHSTGSDTESKPSAPPPASNGASSSNSTKKTEKGTSKGRSPPPRDATTVTLKMTHGSTGPKQKPKLGSGKKEEQPNRGS